MDPCCRVIFLGPPGVGKGTQARRIADRYSLTPLSSGDVLRREMREETALGREAGKFVNAGQLVPDDLITGVMLASIDQASVNGFILDGFPRTIPQAKSLEAGLADRHAVLTAVIDFQVDDAEILERLVHRRTCTSCGSTYNVRFCPPASEGVCDRCGGSVVQREDDREDVIRTRLETYRRQTAPLKAHYKSAGLLRAVDASREPQEVEQEIVAILGRAMEAE